jgi:hypothetical protein
MSAFQTAYLIMVIAAFSTFLAALTAVAVYVRLGDRKPTVPAPAE